MIQRKKEVLENRPIVNNLKKRDCSDQMFREVSLLQDHGESRCQRIGRWNVRKRRS